MKLSKNMIRKEIARRFDLIHQKIHDPKSKEGHLFWEGRGSALWDFLCFLRKNGAEIELLKKYLYRRHLKEKARLKRATEAKKGDPFIGGRSLEFGDLLNWVKAKKVRK